jgi:hypothetical protein
VFSVSVRCIGWCHQEITAKLLAEAQRRVEALEEDHDIEIAKRVQEKRVQEVVCACVFLLPHGRSSREEGSRAVVLVCVLPCQMEQLKESRTKLEVSRSKLWSHCRVQNACFVHRFAQKSLMDKIAALVEQHEVDIAQLVCLSSCFGMSLRRMANFRCGDPRMSSCVHCVKANDNTSRLCRIGTLH